MTYGTFFMLFLPFGGAVLVAGAVDDGRLILGLMGVVLASAAIPIAYGMGQLKERLKNDPSLRQ